MLVLDVPYQEKDEAKRLGARWNTEIKKWYVEGKGDYYQFAKWILPYGNAVICDALYILEGKQKCDKCDKITRVVAFGVERHTYLLGNEKKEYKRLIKRYQKQINIVERIEPMPKPILKYLQRKYSCKILFENRYSNCCDNCRFLLDEVDYLFQFQSDENNPFIIDSIEKVKNLKIYKISLARDIIVDLGAVYYEPETWMLKKYGDIIPLDIEC